MPANDESNASASTLCSNELTISTGAGFSMTTYDPYNREARALPTLRMITVADDTTLGRREATSTYGEGEAFGERVGRPPLGAKASPEHGPIV